MRLIWSILLLLLIGAGAYALVTYNENRAPNQQEVVEVTPQKTYTSETYGFLIDYPEDLLATSTFSRSYFAPGNWSILDTSENAAGDPVVAFMLPNSNEITAGEVRIGVSSDLDQLYECGVPGREGVISSATTTVGGEPFTVYTIGDAGMNQYLNARIYQTVHNDRCYNIEALVKGSNPEVYDPPREAPFDRDQALERLNSIVQNFKFTR